MILFMNQLERERIYASLKGKGEKDSSVTNDEEEGEMNVVSVVSISVSPLPSSSSLCINPVARQRIAHQLLPRFLETSLTDYFGKKRGRKKKFYKPNALSVRKMKAASRSGEVGATCDS